MDLLGCSLMIDFETLGVSRDSVILSGAAICFRGEEILSDSYEEFRVLEQIYEGSTIDPETIAWWKKKNPEEFYRLLFNQSVSTVGAWISATIYGVQQKGEIKEVWSRGHMDFEILNYHLRNPLEYYVFRDVRTLDSLGIAKMKKNSHNALEDCKNQLEYLMEIKRKCQELQGEPLKMAEEVLESQPVGIPLVFPKPIEVPPWFLKEIV